MFGLDNRFSAHTDNRQKNVLDLDEGPTDGLDNTSIMAGAQYFVNIAKSRK